MTGHRPNKHAGPTGSRLETEYAGLQYSSSPLAARHCLMSSTSKNAHPEGGDALSASRRPLSGSSRTIELEVRETNQLFNSMDPSPFRERDLDTDAEAFIESWAQEFPADAALTLRVYLEQWPPQDPTVLIREAVHNYFAYRARQDALEFRRLMQQGRTSLMIGLVFLACCLVVIKTLAGSSTDTWAGVLRESLTIAGWVAMWRPMQIYLYDWWPIRRRLRMHTKLSAMPVEVAPKQKRLVIPSPGL